MNEPPECKPPNPGLLLAGGLIGAAQSQAKSELLAASKEWQRQTIARDYQMAKYRLVALAMVCVTLIVCVWRITA